VEILYKIKSKRIPSIYDENTEYKISEECDECGNKFTTIEVLGAYLPTFKHTFGLIETLGGIIASKDAVEYLENRGVNGFAFERANVTFGKRMAENEEYYWIKPLNEIELNSDKGPGSTITCFKCNMTTWNEKEGINFVNNYIPSDLFLIENTWKIICSEKFMQVSKNVPNKCYLEFEKWEYSLEK